LIPTEISVKILEPRYVELSVAYHFPVKNFLRDPNWEMKIDVKLGLWEGRFAIPRFQSLSRFQNLDTNFFTVGINA